MTLRSHEQRQLTTAGRGMIGGEIQTKKWMASDSVRSLGAMKIRKPYKKQTHNHVRKQYALHPYQTSSSITS